MDLSILIVSHNTRDKTLACLGSIERGVGGLAHEVLVLDNASGDGSAAALAAFPHIQLEALDENLGFARGINRLARRARGEFLLLLNPDTEVFEGAIEELVAFARRTGTGTHGGGHGTAGIWGGRTVRPDGGPDPGFAWGRATPWSTLCNALGLARLFPRSARFNPEGIGGRLGQGEHEVDIVSGCFFLVTLELWRALDGFDPGFFVYGEEGDFCLRARARGIRALVTSSAVILHHGGASESSPAAKHLKLLGAKRRLMELHWSRGRARLGAWLLRLHVLARAAAFTLASPLSARRFGPSARCWREVWRSRSEWLAGPLDAAGPGHARAQRILAISSGGGHWLQLQRIRTCFEGHDIAWATVHAAARDEVGPARFYTLRDASRWNRLGLLVLAWQTLRVVLRERPDIVVTTGAAPGLFGVMFAKLVGARTLWIDSIANAERLSLSGRLAGRFADLWLTQWQHLEGPRGPHFHGTVV